jgi:hypothetical protein
VTSDGRTAHRRRLALLAAAVLAALTAFSWWLSGRWLARPEPPPDASRTGPQARP